MAIKKRQLYPQHCEFCDNRWDGIKEHPISCPRCKRRFDYSQAKRKPVVKPAVKPSTKKRNASPYPYAEVGKNILKIRDTMGL